MQHEKILKRPDGSRVKISVYLRVDTDKVYWSHYISRCDPGKRKFTTGNMYYAATLEEIKEVQMELIEKIKPV